MMTKADIQNFIPEILADGIVLGMISQFDFYKDNLIQVVNRPDMAAGRQLKVPTRTIIGLLQDKTEGLDMQEDKFTTDSILITPTVKALKVPYSLEANGGYDGDLGSVVEADLTAASVKTLDNSIFVEISSVPGASDIDKSTQTINFEDISAAMATLQIADPTKFTLFVSYNQMHQLRILKDSNGNSVWAPVNLADVQVRGQVGTIYGIKVVASNKIVANAGVVRNFLVEDSAVMLVWGNQLFLEAEKDFSKQVFITYATMVYGTELDPSRKVKGIKFKE